MLFNRAIAPVDRSSTSIESAFLEAGDSLGKGLSTFEQLSADLAALAREFNSGDMASASAALENLSAELVLVSRRLPEDAATLRRLVTGTATISERLESLLEKLRMMTSITHNFRIEAAAFNEDSGLTDFTKDISRLTSAAKAEVSRCANKQEDLTAQLRHAERAQVALDGTYREKLLTLADNLSQSFAKINERQHAGLDLMQDVAARSSQIAKAAGMAFISLQSGDRTRQRLEHIAGAIRSAEKLSDGKADVDVPEHIRHATVAALCELQAAQLRDAVDGFTEDATQVDGTLERLVSDAAAIVSAGLATYSSNSEGDDTFLSSFKANLATASELLQSCEASRQEVQSAMADLGSMLRELDETIHNVSLTSQDLLMVGLNAGLKASRLGSAAKSLIVVADELKRLSQSISRETPELIKVFADAREISLLLGRDSESSSTQPLRNFHQEIVSIIASLDSADGKTAVVLDGFLSKVSVFREDLTAARQNFGRAVAMNDDLLAAVDDLTGAADTWEEQSDAMEVSHWVDAIARRAYTMPREHEIHAQTLGLSPQNPDLAGIQLVAIDDTNSLADDPLADIEFFA